MGEDWELFATVVDAGSLSAAGRRLGLSPAMVSKRLARLEARLGGRLVHRTTRRLVTTGPGRAFYEEAVAILAAAAAAEARVAGAGEPAGRLRVSAPTSFGRRHVAPHLAGFLVRHPGVALELDLADAFVDLVGERVDCAIRIGTAANGALASMPLAPNRRLLCAAPDYLARHGAPADLDALRHHRLLAATGQAPWRLDGPDGTASVAVESLVHTNSSEVARELALAGAGIALRSLWDVADALADGRLVRVLPAWEGARDIAIHAVWPRTPFVAPAVQAFVAHLRDLYATARWEHLVS